LKPLLNTDVHDIQDKKIIMHIVNILVK